MITMIFLPPIPAPPPIVWHFDDVRIAFDAPNGSAILTAKLTLSWTAPAEEIDLEYVDDGRYVFYAWTRGAPSNVGRIPLAFGIPPWPVSLPPYDLEEIARSNLCYLDVRATPSHAVYDLMFVAIPSPEDIDRSGVADSTDFFIFLGLLFEADSAADFTLDGSVDSADFFEFLSRWFQAQ